MYEPTAIDEPNSSLVQIDGKKVEVHDIVEVGMIGKLKFYFSSKEAFAVYFNRVVVWLLAMFVAAGLSTFLNNRAPN